MCAYAFAFVGCSCTRTQRWQMQMSHPWSSGNKDLARQNRERIKATCITVSDRISKSKIIKAYQSMLDQQMGQDMPGWAKVRRFSMILPNPDPVARSSWTWCASIRCASVPPSTCWAYRCCMHLHAVVVLSCGHGAGWDERIRKIRKDKKGQNRMSSAFNNDSTSQASSYPSPAIRLFIFSVFLWFL
jgi:hypothetical protein